MCSNIEKALEQISLMKNFDIISSEVALICLEDTLQYPDENYPHEIKVSLQRVVRAYKEASWLELERLARQCARAATSVDSQLGSAASILFLEAGRRAPKN